MNPHFFSKRKFKPHADVIACHWTGKSESPSYAAMGRDQQVIREGAVGVAANPPKQYFISQMLLLPKKDG